MDTGWAEPELQFCTRTQSYWALCDLCSGVVFCVQWLRSSFAACCYLGLMMWFIISKEISRNWDHAAALWNRRLSHCAGKLQDKLGGIFYLPDCLYLSSCFCNYSHVSLFLSIVRRQKTVKIHVETGKAQHVQAKVESVRMSAGALSCGAC